MPEDKEKLKSMLDNIIDDKHEEAQIDFHDYLQDKMQSVMKPDEAVPVNPSTDEE